MIGDNALAGLGHTLLVERPWTHRVPGAVSIGALLGVAVLYTALAYILYFRILATTGSTNLVLITFLIPVSTILLGIGFLGEVLLKKHIMRVALIRLGPAANDGRLWM